MNEKIKEGTDFEISCQQIVDPFYESKGLNIDRSCSCREYDLMLNDSKVEEKFRTVDYGDFLIEIIQDVASGNEGWYYKTKADNIAYWATTKILYFVKWEKFKYWFINKYKIEDDLFRVQKSIIGYGLTINVSIKWSDVPAYLYIKRVNNG